MVNKHPRDVSIEVVSRHQHVSDKTRAVAEEKAQRLSRFNDRISRVQVILDEEHGQFLSEVIAHVDRDATLVSKGEASGYRASMDMAFEKLGRQLKKHKEIRRNHKHDPATDAQPGATDVDGEPSFEDAVRDNLTD